MRFSCKCGSKLREPKSFFSTRIRSLNTLQDPYKEMTEEDVKSQVTPTHDWAHGSPSIQLSFTFQFTPFVASYTSHRADRKKRIQKKNQRIAKSFWIEKDQDNSEVFCCERTHTYLDTHWVTVTCWHMVVVGDMLCESLSRKRKRLPTTQTHQEEEGEKEGEEEEN